MSRRPLLLVSSIALVLFILFILSLWILPKWQVAGAKFTSDKDRLELVDKIRGTLAQIGAGIGIALGLYFTWRRVAAAERTVQVAQEGQITERFTRAIDQLGATYENGNKRLEIRLGGIYALERIARDSEKDHWPIMEVLTAYVREHVPWKESSPPEQVQPPDSAAHSSQKDTSQQGEPQAQPRPDTDIQAILTVIGRRTRRYGKGEDQRLDLRRTDLRRANLRNVHLEGALLIGTHLEGALLHNAYLQGVVFDVAHLEKADIRNAHLQGAFFVDAHLEGVFLIDAHLDGAHLSGTHLDGAILHKAYLARADLHGTHLDGAHLHNAHLEGADLRYAHGLTQEQVNSAYTDENTLLPDYLTSSQATDGEEEA